MGKVVNDKATLIATWENDYASSDFQYIREDLYAIEGAFFVHSQGGALTPYVGGRIQFMTEDEGRRWVESREIDPEVAFRVSRVNLAGKV